MLPLNNAVQMLSFLLGTNKEVIRRFVRVLRESGRGFFNDIGKGQKGGILLRSLLNTILAHEMTNNQPVLALEAVSAVNALQLVGCTTKIGDKTEERDAVGIVPFMQVLEETVRMVGREADKRENNKKLTNALLPKQKPAFGTVRITFGGWIDRTKAEIDWPEQSGFTTFYFAVQGDDQWMPTEEDFKKPHNYFSRKTVTIERFGLEAFARLARNAEDFDADLNTSSDPVPGSAGEVEDSAIPENANAAAGLASNDGLPEYPAPKAQATPRDPIKIEGSLQEQAREPFLPATGPGFIPAWRSIAGLGMGGHPAST